MAVRRIYAHDNRLTIASPVERAEQRKRYKAQRYSRQYRNLRKQVLAEEALCHLCGLPPTPNDPLTVDHLNGSSNERSNLRAAHSSCNSRRAAREAEGGGLVAKDTTASGYPANSTRVFS
jgi:5-methylcytosine-specific restriction endonuclease McrA